MERLSPPARLAFCGNIFPAESAADAFEVLRSRLPALQQACAARGLAPGRVGFGLYLAAAAVAEFLADPAAEARYRQALQASGWPVWTANAFPFGGFHGRRVKERAFLPDWSSDERLDYSRGVAGLLARCLEAAGDHARPSDRRGSVSTCPLGYGAAVRQDPSAAARLRRMGEELDALRVRHGVDLCLALEPEPDGAFERVPELATWLAREVGHPAIGICWDLCHSAVVGESAAEVLQALQQTGIRLGKVQVSAALRGGPDWSAAASTLLHHLAGDAYFHQVRAHGARPSGARSAWPDLPELLADSAWTDTHGLAAPPEPAAHDWRIHCHVPLHRERFATGLQATDWVEMVQAARAAGVRDFEVETYTLPGLPSALQDPEASSIEAVMAAELQLAAEQIGLDTASVDA